MCVATIKTATAAQLAKKILSAEGIYSTVVSVDPALTKYGCSWGISFSCRERKKVIMLFNKNKIPYGDIFGSGI